MQEHGVTLVIPLRDEAATVAALVESVAAQTRTPDAVIFVDAGSTDDTPSRLGAACADRPTWSLRHAGPATPGRARNVGIEAAETPWVALTDAGASADAHWLERLVRAADADPGVDVVWGHYEPVADTWFTACASLVYVAVPTVGGHGPVRDTSVASCLLRRSVWQQAGHFPDLRAAEDLIFIRRVRDLGAGETVAPEAVVWWHLQPSWASTFRRFRRYSEVNARAGEQRFWHYRVARMYLAALPFLLLGLRRPRWALVPLVGAVARVEKSIWVRRQGRGPLWAANPARVATVAAILAAVDAGTFSGWLRASFGAPRRPGPG